MAQYFCAVFNSPNQQFYSPQVGVTRPTYLGLFITAQGYQPLPLTSPSPHIFVWAYSVKPSSRSNLQQSLTNQAPQLSHFHSLSKQLSTCGLTQRGLVRPNAVFPKVPTCPAFPSCLAAYSQVGLFVAALWGPVGACLHTPSKCESPVFFLPFSNCPDFCTLVNCCLFLVTRVMEQQ